MYIKPCTDIATYISRRLIIYSQCNTHRHNTPLNMHTHPRTASATVAVRSCTHQMHHHGPAGAGTTHILCITSCIFKPHLKRPMNKMCSPAMASKSKMQPVIVPIWCTCRRSSPVKLLQDLGGAGSTPNCSHLEVVQLLVVAGHVLQQPQEDCGHASCTIHLEVLQCIVHTGSVQIGTCAMHTHSDSDS